MVTSKHLLPLVSVLLILSLIISGCIGPKTKDRGEQLGEALPCSPLGYFQHEKADYLILAPKNLFSGSEASLTMSAFSGDLGISRCLEVSVTGENGSTILTRNSTGNGTAVASFRVPALKQGAYTMAVRDIDTNETLEAQVQVIEGNAIFVETDKPIYKPGQTIHGRVLVLNNEFKPVKQEMLVEITDAKGIKIFKEKRNVGEFGVASFDLPLASELNLGVWKVTAESGSSKTSVDIRVEKYVLPKFRINATTTKDWYLPDEKISGFVDARYFFGKPVDGEVEVEASRYVGVWETYATFTAPLKNGTSEFTIPEVGYAAGTYGAGGQGSIVLNISVRDTGNHTEKGTKTLTVAKYPFLIQVIPDSDVIKPGLPFQLLAVTKTPDGKPLDKNIAIRAFFTDRNYKQTEENINIDTVGGIAIAELRTPEDAVRVHIEASSEGVSEPLDLSSAYSPSATYIHIVQTGRGALKAGEKADFRVYNSLPGTVYYDILAQDRTVVSGATDNNEISFQLTPEMGKTSKLVVYMIAPNSEVSVDSLPFEVETSSPVKLEASFDREQASPGEAVKLSINAGTKSMVGVSIVDESVYALSEGRLNLMQVFDELERRFMEPQVEVHGYQTKGTYEIMSESGLQVMASPKFTVPRGEQEEIFKGRWEGPDVIAGEAIAPAPNAVPNAVVPSAVAVSDAKSAETPPLAKVERIRQFFPETWVWQPELTTDSDGRAQLDLTVPDTITSWRLHAVSSSEQGFGIAESGLRVFQDFFVEPDLPYAVTRGEEFPVRMQVYNYLNTSQKVYIELDGADWFEALGESNVSMDIGAGSVSSVDFFIRPKKIGIHEIKVTARSSGKADAVIKEIIVEPEGSTFEAVKNGVLNGTVDLDADLPEGIVPDSGKVLLSLTPSIVAQTISGVDNLLNMPYGCGEQNMILFAPDVEVLRYLKSTGQVNPQIRAKAEMFITTGYQRELTYQRNDGSFSAFGDNDREGSLWLSAFVLSTFSGARDVTSIDENVLSRAGQWIVNHQNSDGSWDAVGFIHHQDMMGGINGRFTLTAYAALALSEYGEVNASVNRARSYLEDNLADVKDPYSLAIASLALQKLGSPKANEALDSLMALAKYDENGMYWGNTVEPVREQKVISYAPISSKNVEITAYGALALMEAHDSRANEALKWISAQRNSKGGFTSTQDTVMAFRALITAAVSAGRDIDATVKVEGDGKNIKEIRLSPENYDVLQVIEVPENTHALAVKLAGKGEVNYQLVKKYNVILPDAPVKRDLELNVTYSAKHIEVNDIVNVSVNVRYNGDGGVNTGMLLIDVAVPTGFSPVVESLDNLKSHGIISRYEVAGRKVILYIDDLPAGKELDFGLQIRAVFPVKAIIPDSKAYSYYNPEIKSEYKGGEIKVSDA